MSERAIYRIVRFYRMYESSSEPWSLVWDGEHCHDCPVRPVPPDGVVLADR